MSTIAGTLHLSATYVEHTVSDISQATDTDCLYYGQSPAVAVGDLVAIAAVTATHAWPVTIDSQGFVTVDPDGDTRTDTAAYRMWDATDQTWGTSSTFERTVTPVVSATASATGATTATASVATNVLEGSIWVVVTASATTPTHAQIKAGQTHTGAAAVWHDSDTSTLATTVFAATGLSASTTYYAHATQENAASTPLAASPASSGAFTTTSAASTGMVKDIAQSIARNIAQAGAQ